jgi:hypothetical protein
MNSSNIPGIMRLRIRNLKTGLILARPIHSESGVRLLPEGKKLNKNDIERLKNWNGRIVYVYRPEEPTNDSNPYAEAS